MGSLCPIVIMGDRGHCSTHEPPQSCWHPALVSFGCVPEIYSVLWLHAVSNFSNLGLGVQGR
eukprot:3993688-Amphidinium_carterae.1